MTASWIFSRVLPPHSPVQLGVSPLRPRRPGCTPRAASGRPCGVTRSSCCKEPCLSGLRSKEKPVKANSSLLVLLAFVLNLAYVSSAKADDVEEFIQLLSKPTPPTLDDFHRFYGAGAEDELEIELRVCEKEGWSPPLNNPNCLKYIKDREGNPEKTPSMYFAWLKRKLPTKPKHVVLKIERVEKGDYLPYEIIYTTLDNAKVVFYRPLTHVEHFGRLAVRKIDDVPVAKLLGEDLKGSGRILEEILADIAENKKEPAGR